jgi:hypothetical protein
LGLALVVHSNMFVRRLCNGRVKVRVSGHTILKPQGLAAHQRPQIVCEVLAHIGVMLREYLRIEFISVSPKVKRFLPFLLVTAAILTAGSPGIRPRADVTEYPAQNGFDAAAFGVAVIPPGEVKKIFAADLNGAGYVVIEVGFFPKAGREVDLSPLDFTLLADPNSISERPADADVVAAASAGKQPRPRSETDSSEVNAGASIQHESYPDPVTGRRIGTTITGVSTGVGVGTPAGGPRFPAASTSNRDQLEQQLWAKSLPDGKTSTPVAGYLYFPKPSKKSKNDSWVLRWENTAGKVKIVIQNPAK